MSFIPEDDYSKYQIYLREKTLHQEGEPSPKPKKTFWQKYRNNMLTAVASAIILGLLAFVGSICLSIKDKVETLTINTAVIQNDIGYLKNNDIEINRKLDELLKK